MIAVLLVIFALLYTLAISVVLLFLLGVIEARNEARRLDLYDRYKADWEPSAEELRRMY
jgi:hypothetical protein